MIAWLGEFLVKWGLGWLANWLPGYLQKRELNKQTERANVAEQQVAQDTRVIENVEVCHEAEEEVAAKKDGGTQKVADAAPDTAAGELRDEFSRD